MSELLDNGKMIGEIMMLNDMITENQLSLILREQNKSNTLFGETAVELGLISDSQLCEILSYIYNIPQIDLDFVCVSDEIIALFPYSIASTCSSVAFDTNEQNVSVAISDPGNLEIIDDIINYLQSYNVKFFLSSKHKIDRVLSIMSRKNVDILDPVNFLNSILFEALEEKASDLHFEPNEKSVTVRIRVDGILKVINTFSRDIWPRIQSRLKILSNLNIAETRRPQSGHTRVTIFGKDIDLRISTHPNVWGEGIAIRILDLANGIKKMDELNFSRRDAEFFHRIIHRPHGIFLIAGPTGSGKTTTLYSLLHSINDDLVNIMTLEDPVEYQIKGVKQLDLRDEGVLTFSDGIRSILRQDPDVIFVGEIRDEKTAAAVLRAALTGKLVFATLHASDPIDTLRRLTDLNVNICEFATQLVGIMSQRLLRKINTSIKHTGKYRGRIPVTEFIYINRNNREKIISGDYRNLHMDRTFKESINELLDKGLTDTEEIQRIFGHEIF